MDEVILTYLNAQVGKFPLFDAIVGNIGGKYFKLLPFLVTFWALWFWGPEPRTRQREALVSALLIAIPAAIISRALAKILPFSVRPLHDDRLNAVTSSDVTPMHLDGWSSMPSDHAAIFFAISAAIFMISRPFGVICFLHSLIAVAFVRVYFAWHWPSDILVGGLLGITIAVIGMPILTWVLKKTQIIPFFEAREWLGYPLLFLLTYEVSQMFSVSSKIADGLSAIF